MKIGLTNKHIEIQPEYEIEGEFAGKLLHFFESFVYVDKMGFFRLSEKGFLPPEFRKNMDLEPSPEFFSKTIEILKPFTIEIDPRLVPPKNLELYCKKLQWDDHKKQYLSEFCFKKKRGKSP